jgi:hypothetical protein
MQGAQDIVEAPNKLGKLIPLRDRQGGRGIVLLLEVRGGHYSADLP